MATAPDEPEALRDALVEALLQEGHVRTPSVESAMRSVPRHLFIPEVSVREAYENFAIPITGPAGDGVSSLSAPAWVAVMLEELALTPGMRVLEVGAGTGYHAALLACLVGAEGRVVTVEIEPWLVERARERLAEQGLDQARVVEGDGALGCPDEGPFDRILLTTGTWEVFPAWIDQLVAGGSLVAPLQFAGDEEQACIVANLVCEGDHLVGRPVMGANMVPMRGEVGGRRSIESSVAGEGWKPTSTTELTAVRVYPRSASVEPGRNEKLFVRGECQILLERPG